MNKTSASLEPSKNRSAFLCGMRDGIPISLGYFAVSFSLGITAKKAGLTAFQGMLASFLCNASAGEYAAFVCIAANSAYIELAIVTLIANARYLLMSFAMSQRMDPKTSMAHRLLMAYDITDELFGIAIAQKGYLNPYYTYGAVLVAVPGWSVGTFIGVLAGNLLPLRIVSAFSVALYGMFLAIIIPPAKKDKVIALLVPICFAASYAFGILPIIKSLSAGTRTIILTVLISSLTAVIFPKKEEMTMKEGTKIEE